MSIHDEYVGMTEAKTGLPAVVERLEHRPAPRALTLSRRRHAGPAKAVDSPGSGAEQSERHHRDAIAPTVGRRTRRKDCRVDELVADDVAQPQQVLDVFVADS